MLPKWLRRAWDKFGPQRGLQVVEGDSLTGAIFGSLPTVATYCFRNSTALKTVKPQNKKGLTETLIFPSGACFTLNSTSFSAVVSATVTSNSPMQVTACAARFLEFVSIVSSNLYTAPCLAFSQIANFSASEFESPTIAATELEFLTA
jgi:hypothetical protein